MPRNRHFSLIALFMGIAVAATLAVQACPYCPPTDATLSQKLEESDTACIVKFLSSKDGEELSRQTTTFQVVKSFPAKVALKADHEITTSFGVTGKRGDIFLLMGQMKDGEMEWNLPIPLDELGNEYTYLRNAPPIEEPQVQRLRYFLKFLDHKNLTISNDAFGEFARAKFEDVEQLALELSREKVRKWLEDSLDDANPQLVVRRAFYGMLLGLCGNEDDAAYLGRKIFAPIDPTKLRIGFDGLMGGYLLLKGPAGLLTVLEKKVDSLPPDLIDDPRVEDLSGLRATLTFLWDFRRSQFTEQSLRAAMRRFLDRPQYAEVVIADLARWKDWDSLEGLIKAYGHEPWETRSAKEKIVAYALSCGKDTQTPTSPELIASKKKAQEFLDGLDPAFVESVKRMMGGQLPPTKPIVTVNGANESSE